MFDIGFWELGLIALVALLVVGPERLPKLARTAGLWLGRGRRLLSSVKADIDRELKEILDKQARNNPLEEILEDTQETLQDSGRAAESALKEAQAGGKKGQ